MPKKKSTDSITRAESLADSLSEEADLLPEENSSEENLEESAKTKTVRKSGSVLRKKKTVQKAESKISSKMVSKIEPAERTETDTEQTIAVHESKVVIEPIYPEYQMADVEPVEFIAPHGAELRGGTETSQPRMDGVKPSPNLEANNLDPNDRSFLAPENFSFGLKDRLNRKHRKPKTVLAILYFLIGVLVLSALAIVFLTFYTAHKLNEQSAVVSTPPRSSANSNTGTAQIPKLGIVAGTAQQNFLAAAIKNNATESALLTADTPTSLATSIPTGTTDTLYIKNSGSASQSLLSFLGQYGLKPQLTQKSDLADDFVLYLAPTDASVDLSSLSAAAYNASGKAGLAKQYCGYLTSYHTASCSALNASSPSTGITVATKEPYLILTLGRAAQFQNATFTAAASGQVEDIRVTLGK